MKCLYLTPGIFDKGGISRYNRYQIQSLRDILGEDCVFVLSFLGPNNTMKDIEVPFKVNWHGKTSSSSFYSILEFAGHVFKYVVAFRPTLIWSSHIHFSSLVWFLAKYIGALSVVQVYGREVWSPRRFRPDIYAGFIRCDYVVSDCYFTAEYVRGNLRKGETVEVIWDCVDTEKYYPAPPSQVVLDRYKIPDPKKHFNLLTLGRLSSIAAYKGYERLLEVLPALPQNARLIYGGGGDLMSALKEKAQRLGVAQQVTFTGFIAEDDLPDVYRSGSVFCLVSDRGPGRGEGIPLTPLEAAACGVPILVGNQDGSREAVEQGVNGFALDPFDLYEIGQHLTQLARDDSLRIRMGQAARLRVVSYHAYPVFRQKMEQFLNRSLLSAV